MAKSNLKNTALVFAIDTFVLLLILCGYVALHTYIAMQSFHFLELIMFLNAALLSHLLPFTVGALMTLLLAGMGVKYFLNPLITPPDYARLLKPITYRITIKGSQTIPFNQKAIERCIEKIRNTKKNDEDERTFATQTLATFFANLFNASRASNQYSLIVKIMERYGQKHFQKARYQVDIAFLIATILQQIDFLSLQCQSTAYRMQLSSLFVKLAVKYKIKCPAAAFLRPPLQHKKRENGAHFLDIIAMQFPKKSPLDKVNLIIKELLDPLKEYAGPSLINPLLSENAPLCGLLPQPHHDLTLCRQQSSAFGQLLQYQIDCLKKPQLRPRLQANTLPHSILETLLIKKNQINQLEAVFGEHFLIKLMESIEATTLTSAKKQTVWNQYIQHMKKLNQLDNTVSQGLQGLWEEDYQKLNKLSVRQQPQPPDTQHNSTIMPPPPSDDHPNKTSSTSPNVIVSN